MDQRFTVLSTPLLATSYEGLRADLLRSCEKRQARTLDFSNTHIVTAMRHDPTFRAVTSVFDTFVPDGMPLIWCMNAQGAGLKDRVYGPTFTRHFLGKAPGDVTHYFLGGSQECLDRLIERMRSLNPALNVVGSHHGYFSQEQESSIVAGIVEKDADFLWVGLGTPKQQEWIARHRQQLGRTIVCAVGFAFDVNAGMKKDAPLVIQRLGLTWLFRMAAEPRRLLGRYLYFNSLFLYYLLRDLFSGGDRPSGAANTTST
jgi:N-acetylglucosaminyldiphosphoundecaprenol N-acetyl-beta-D-mannosaminyltransferase